MTNPVVNNNNFYYNFNISWWKILFILLGVILPVIACWFFTGESKPVNFQDSIFTTVILYLYCRLHSICTYLFLNFCKWLCKDL